MLESSRRKGELIPDEGKGTRKYTGVRKCKAEWPEAAEKSTPVSTGRNADPYTL